MARWVRNIANFPITQLIGRLIGTMLPFNMKSAAYTGLLSSGMIQQPNPPFSCPSGNCTWDPFGTLGISVKCFDISDHTYLNCATSPDEPRSDLCRIAIDQEKQPNYTRVTVDPEHDEQSQGSTVFFFGSYYADWSVDLNGSVWPVPSGGLAGRADIEWIRATNLNKEDEFHYIDRNSIVDSGSCKMYMGLHEVSARVDNGIYTETILRENINADYITGVLNLPRKFTYTYQPTHDAPVDFNITSTQATILLQGMLGATGDQGNMTLGRSDELRGPDIMKMLYLTSNLTDTMYTLAHYMNVALRANDTLLHFQADPRNLTGMSADYIAPSHRVHGTVYVNRTFVEMRWAWLALPGALALLVAVLLVGTMMQTRRKRVGVWKDSPLAVLLQSRWDVGSKPEYQRARTADEARRNAVGLRARVEGELVRIY